MSSATDATYRREARLPDLPSDPASDGRRADLRAATDEELVVRHLEGDEYAFHELVDRYEDRLLGWIEKKVGDRAEAEDLLQRTYMRVYRHLHRFDPDRTFSTWIYTIAGNLVKNVYRSRSRDPVVLFQTLTKDRAADERPLQWADADYLPDEMAHRRELRTLVDEVIAELPEHHRKVFVLRERDGLTYEEIADATGLKLGTVKSRLSRARKRFGDLVADRLEEPVPA